MAFVARLLEFPAFPLFLIAGLGVLLGSVRLRGFSFGAAGVLFAALLYGHVTHRSLPRPLMDVGLLLFVYAVGLQAGPRFFGILRQRGKEFVLVATVATTAGAVATVILARAFGLSPELAAGVFAGATTCTPALAAATDLMGTVASKGQGVASVGYGVAYPFAAFGVVALVQALPRLMRTPARAAAEIAEREEAARREPPSARSVRISNRNFAGRTVEEVRSLRVAQAVVSRVERGGIVQPVRPGTLLALGDVVRIVGPRSELAKLQAMLGEAVDQDLTDGEGDVASEEIVASHPDAVYRTLRDLGVWERMGVVVTRVRREGVEFVPTGALRIEPGDVLRVVGTSSDVAAFAQTVGQAERRLDETALAPFALGLALGAAVGMIPIPLPGGLTSRLGVSGGAFIVGLLLGRVGRGAAVRLYVPNAARLFARELGLVVFLACVGTGAGVEFAEVVRRSGPGLVLVSVTVTVVTAGIAVLLMRRAARLNVLTIAGALGGCMTSSTALNAATGLVDSEAQAVGFASMYPLALIAKIVLVQVVYLVLRALAGG